MNDFLTFADVKASSVARIAGVCAGKQKFTDYVNEAVRRLMTRGDWSQTLVPIHMCIKRGCVTWPRFVGSVRKLNLCGTPVPVTNLYANYLDRDLWPNWYDFPNLGTWGQLGNYYNLYHQGFGDDLRYTFAGANKVGYYSTYNDPPTGTSRLLRAYPQYPQDIGKTIRWYGKDENGQRLRTKVTATDGTVTWEDGIVITLASPYGSPDPTTSSSVEVQGPCDRVIKDKTQGNVWLYAYDSTNDVLLDLAVYGPSETRPTYERMSIPGVNVNTDGSCKTTVMGLVKLRFIPVESDNDLILVPNIDAIKAMVQAQLFEDANDPEKADAYEARAIRELNLQLRDQYPEDQTPVTVEPFSATGIGPQAMF